MKPAQQPPRGARGESSRSQVGFTCAPPTRSSAEAGALLPFHPACLAIGARRGRGPGGAVANNSSGCVHPTPGPSSPSQLPAGPAEPAGELTLPGSQARPGPERWARVRGRTQPNGLFQAAPLLAPGGEGGGPHPREDLPTSRSPAAVESEPGAQHGGRAPQERWAEERRDRRRGPRRRGREGAREGAGGGAAAGEGGRGPIGRAASAGGEREPPARPAGAPRGQWRTAAAGLKYDNQNSCAARPAANGRGARLTSPRAASDQWRWS